MRDIKKYKWRTSYNRAPRILGTAVLSNTGDYSTDVETAFTYSYDKNIYWGTVEGVARGLPTEVYENPKSSPLNLGPAGWGSKINETKVEVRVFTYSFPPFSIDFRCLVCFFFVAATMP